MSRVEDLGKAGHELGHDRGKDLVPCCQEQRCGGRKSSALGRFLFIEGLGRVVFDALRHNLRYSTSHIGQLWSNTLLFDNIRRKGRGILPNFAVERIHLLKRITLELSAIQRLHSHA